MSDLLTTNGITEVYEARNFEQVPNSGNSYLIEVQPKMSDKGVIKAKDYDKLVSGISSTTIKVWKNIYSTGGIVIVYAKDVFGNLNDYSKFDAFPVLSGTFSGAHWGRMTNTTQSINKVTYHTTGSAGPYFKIDTTATRVGWSTGSQSALYFDLVIIGHIKPGYLDTIRTAAERLEQLSNNARVGDYYKPATNLQEIIVANPYAQSGVYWIKPNGFTDPFQIYCKIYNNRVYGLVWSNLRGKQNRPTTSMTLNNATTLRKPFWNTPWVQDTSSVIPAGTPIIIGNIETWEAYTPLDTWNKILMESKGKLMYEWASNYDAAIVKRLRCDISPFTSTDNYKLKLSNCVEGSDAGIWNYHNGRQFTTTNSDHDAYGANCANYYSGTPWWYGACWSGSINGGGESSGQGYYNGAYWTHSHRMWGTGQGYGAGNGWLYISPEI